MGKSGSISPSDSPVGGLAGETINNSLFDQTHLRSGGAGGGFGESGTVIIDAAFTHNILGKPGAAGKAITWGDTDGELNYSPTVSGLSYNPTAKEFQDGSSNQPNTILGKSEQITE